MKEVCMFSGGKDSLATLISSGCKECVYLKSLEDKYGGHWGNGVSLAGVSKETKIEAYGCYECFVHAMTTKQS